jgi:hypothetical protein
VIPFQASNIGFALPRCNYYKVEIVTGHGPSCYVKVGADNREDAMAFALRLKSGFIAINGGFGSMRCRECGQFEAVLQ